LLISCGSGGSLYRKPGKGELSCLRPQMAGARKCPEYLKEGFEAKIRMKSRFQHGGFFLVFPTANSRESNL